MSAQFSPWRFIPSVVLVLIVATLARLQKVPVHVGIPPSMQRSGLAERLAAQFVRDTGFPIAFQTIPMPAIDASIRRGDLDILFAHDAVGAAALDQALRKQKVLGTTFIIVGPVTDPAHVSGAWSAADALRRIASSESPYQCSPVQSAASAVETVLWRTSSAGVVPADNPAGSVEAALAKADAHKAYMIVDTPTFYRFGNRENLTVLFANDPLLLDTYSVAELRHNAVHGQCSKSFWRWFNSPKGRAVIQRATADGRRDYFVTH